MIKLILSILALALSSLFFPAVINSTALVYYVDKPIEITNGIVIGSVGFWGPSASMYREREDTKAILRSVASTSDARQRNV